MRIFHINNQIKHISKIPFINYENGSFIHKQDINFTYMQEYRRGQSGLEEFLQKFKEEFKKYNLLLNTHARADAKTQQLIDIENKLNEIFEEFIDSFNDNKDHIDNDKIYFPYGNWKYKYNYGKTTLQINFDLVMILTKRILREHTKKNYYKNCNNNYNIKYEYILNKISLESIRE